jgi:NRAMP (natural resistance-associated macrophage protein)-like metal ion transporter
MSLRVPSLRRLGRPRRPARALALLALLGPGLIAANAGNDAGGVATYATDGARYAYGLLWVMVLITVSLVVVQEMAARMGAVTGKGLMELIREQYGVRWATVASVSFLLTSVGICISDFVGVGAALGLAGVPAQASVPVAAVAIWLLVVRGSYKLAERVFVAMTLPFFAYPIAAILAKPDWGSVARHAVVPSVHTSSGYLLLLVATAGTTITPYMQLYLQSAVVERGTGEDGLRAQRAEVVAGSVFANVIAGFIIVATGATLFRHGIHDVGSASDAAKALKPLAGRYAELLFGIGLLGASLLAAAVLPVTGAYVVAETIGFEKGLSHRPREAPVFVAAITAIVVVSALVAMVPGLPVISLLLGVQTVNGVLLPIILIFIWRLARNRELLGPHANSRAFDVLATATVLWTSALSLILLAVTVF